MLENYQVEDGITVPEVLRKYIPGQPDFLPYTRALPKDSTSQRAAKNPGADGAAGKMQNLQVK